MEEDRLARIETQLEKITQALDRLTHLVDEYLPMLKSLKLLRRERR